MKNISFVKMSGAGNDFIIVDKIVNADFEPNSEIITKLCSRRTGIGADGLIMISDSASYDFHMQYYNADGSTGTLCGNGARCAIRYAKYSGRLKYENALFKSGEHVYRGVVLGDDCIRFFLNPPEDLRFDLVLNEDDIKVKGDFLNTGSPHLIVNIKDVFGEKKSFQDLNDFPVFDLGKKLRYNENFDKGTNVNFIDIKDDRVWIRTYERGVEDETLACGTGSTAAAIISCIKYGLKPPIRLITRSYDELEVDFNFSEGKVNNISLTGPAKILFLGEFQLNKFI
ncbi:MAG TPA: diaminopimelate epimerase [Ignavibacteriaceae bacterium]|nr:diaminopimelate epimerase [Ignavibacteriaceae bacterium]